ncbi:hypothetical protein ADL04_06385 [Streptomyces sp. NRRL B-3648]|nr:hypothetical protein ADL04_06385 [Streptomyces sp. NRRL B-3648]
MDEDQRQDRDGDLDVPQVGQQLGEPVRTDQRPAQAGVQAQQRAVRHDLPGDQREEDGREGEERGAADYGRHGAQLGRRTRGYGEGGRPPRNRGGGSEAAVRTGTSLAPGGLGRRPSDR